MLHARLTVSFGLKLFLKPLKFAFSVFSFISYPRTETNIFPKDIDLRKLVEDQCQHPIWGAFAQNLLELDQGPTPRNGRKSDKAHPPIHPTKFTNSLSVGIAYSKKLLKNNYF